MSDTNYTSDEDNDFPCPPSAVSSHSLQKEEEVSELNLPSEIDSLSLDSRVSEQSQIVIPEHILYGLSRIARLYSQADSGYLSSSSRTLFSRQSLSSLFPLSSHPQQSPSLERSDPSKLSTQRGKSIGVRILGAIRSLIRLKNDPKRTHEFNWSPNEDNEMPLASGCVSPNKQFHTHELCRQNAKPDSRETRSHLQERPIYNVSMSITASGISALSDEDEDMSCPPSPAVSEYSGGDVGDKTQQGPSISVDDGELFSYKDHPYERCSGHDFHPSDEDPHYHQKEDLYNSHTYAPSQASSFGFHNLFKGQSGNAETGYGSQQDVHYHHHPSCDSLCSLGVPHCDNRTGSASSVRSDRTHSMGHSKGSSRSGKSSRSGRSNRLEVEHGHMYPGSTSSYEDRHRRRSPSSQTTDQRNHDESIGDMMLMAISCLMHQEDCQIPKCPCKEVKERFQHLLP